MNITNLLTDNNISDVCETQINIEVLELMNKDLALDLKNEANLGTKNIENTSDIAKINDEKSINLELGGNSNSSDGEDNNKTKDNEITIKNLTVNDLILRQNKNTIYYLPEEHNLRIRSRVYDFSSLKECIVSEDVDNIRTCSDKEFFKFYNDNQFYKSERCFEVSNFLNFCTFDNFVEFARRNNIRTVEDYHRYYIYFFYESKVIMFLNKDYYTGYLKGIALVEAHTQNRYKKDSIIPTIDAASSISIKEEKDIQNNGNVAISGELTKADIIEMLDRNPTIIPENYYTVATSKVYNFSNLKNCGTSEDVDNIRVCLSEDFLEFATVNNLKEREDFYRMGNVRFCSFDDFIKFADLNNIRTVEDYHKYFIYFFENEAIMFVEKESFYDQVLSNKKYDFNSTNDLNKKKDTL